MKRYFANVMLVVTVWIYAMTGLILRVYFPGTVFSDPELPLMGLLILIPLVLEQFIHADEKRNPIASLILAGLTFALLPKCAGISEHPVWLLFLAGSALFGVLDFLYTSMGRRMKSGSAGALAPAVNGFLLYLAIQCLQGIL